MILLIVLSVTLLAAAGALVAARRWKRPGAARARVVLSGGGTGGHVNPALAIAEGLKAREPQTRFLYIGVKNKAEGVIVGKAGYELRYVCSEGYPGISFSFKTLRFLFKLALGIVQSIVILTAFTPERIVATGGYVSAPVIMAAVLLKKLGIARVKIFLHEQNSIPGQLNALMGKWADKVLLTFPQTLSFFPKAAVVGYPIRNSIVPIPAEEARKRLSFSIPEGRQIIFAFGGSQGARTINRAIVDALPFLFAQRDKLFIIHGSGLACSAGYNAAQDTEQRIAKVLTPEQNSHLCDFYYRKDYFHNIAQIYSLSSLIVCRSGAGSLNEISRIGKPVLLIPKVNLPGDHQVMNARAMRKAGAAEILFEDTIMENGGLLEHLDGRVLAEKILALIEDRPRLCEMAEMSKAFLRCEAIERIVSEIHEDKRFTDGNGRVAPFRDLVANARLLQMLSNAHARSGKHFDPALVVEDPDDLAYYRHRAAGLLSRKNWQDRNLGVKLIGLTRHREKIPTLLQMLSDRTPAGVVRRAFGGDFEQVGFIRRNIVSALMVMGRFDQEVEKHLLEAMEDPYFEVRAQACRAVAHFGPRLAGKQEWLDRLLEHLGDEECFEVAIEAAKAVGEIGTESKAAKALLSMNESHYWQVRNAALLGIKRMIERGVLEPSDELISDISTFILTSTDFRPHFQIKETYAALRKCSEGLKGVEICSQKASGSNTAAGKIK